MSSKFELPKIFADFTVVSIPTRTNFRGINFREAALFQGPEGWSEFSPFLEYGPTESKTWLTAAIEGAYRPWPAAVRTEIEVNATLPRVSADQVAQLLNRFPGCKTVKIKVNDFVTDSNLIEATLDHIPDAKIRLDVNGGWTLQEALLNLHDYHLRFGKVFEYVEQPCLDLSDLKKLKAEIPIKIAVDESIRKYLNSDMGELRDCADIAIIKWAPSGGIAAAKELIMQIGLPTVVSSALDTGIGISHNVALASSLTELPYACGLGTVALLVDDIVSPALIPHEGKLRRERVVPDSALLHKYRATEDRQIWWQDRVLEIWNSGLSDEVAEMGWI